MQRQEMFSPLVAAAALFAAASFGEPVAACSLFHHADNGRYVGGDLVTQVAAKAELIQIVRVRAKHIVTRTYSLGGWYLDTGETDVPDHYPEFVDQFVFELEVIDTLKGALTADNWLVDRNLRMLGYDATVLNVVAAPAPSEARPHPNRLPGWLLDRPGDGGYAFIAANENSDLSLGSCALPYILEVGQTLVALRRSDGRLYPSDGAFPLRIDVEFNTGERRRRREHLTMQSLIPVTGADDPFVTRLNEAIARAQ